MASPVTKLVCHCKECVYWGYNDPSVQDNRRACYQLSQMIKALFYTDPDFGCVKGIDRECY